MASHFDGEMVNSVGIAVAILTSSISSLNETTTAGDDGKTSLVGSASLSIL